jgi:MFS family permease
MRVGELHERPPAPDESVSALDGLRYVTREPALRAIMIVVCFVSVFGQNFRVVLPVLAATSLHGDAQTYAWLTAMLGLGALIGGFLTAGLEYPTRRGLMISCTTFAAANIMVAIAPVTVVALAGMVVMGIGNIALNTISRSLLQLVGDPAMGSRVMAVYSMVFLGSNPIGAPISGLLCTVGGARTALVAAGALSLLPAVALVPRLRLPPQRGIPTLAVEELE